MPNPQQIGLDALTASLERSPELFPHAYDTRSDTVTLVRLARGEFEAASFLDERVLGPHTLTRKLPWDHLAAAVGASRLQERCNFIFHIGHVGSTLLSRLLGTDKAVFALLEPAILRTLAERKSDPAPHAWSDEDFEDRLSALLKLWSRTFEPQQTALIKATSFVSELAADLLARESAPKAVLVYVKPETYIATILGGPNAREEAKQLTPQRLQRLNRRLGRDAFASLGEGEALAMTWATEMAGLVEARVTAGTRTLCLDFDEFLSRPEEILFAAFRFLDCETTSEAVRRVLAGPLMQRYSKAPEHAYGPETRRAILDDARKANSGEILQGLRWLESAATAHPIIRGCLEFGSA